MEKFRFFKNDLIILFISLLIVGLTLLYQRPGLCNHQGRLCQGTARGLPFAFYEYSSHLGYFGVKLIGFFADWAILTSTVFLIWLLAGFLKGKIGRA